MRINDKIGLTNLGSHSNFLLHRVYLTALPAFLKRERVSSCIAVVATIPQWLILSNQKQNGVLNLAIKSRRKNLGSVCALDNLVGDI
jgi:hypothetical protein